MSLRQKPLDKLLQVGLESGELLESIDREVVNTQFQPQCLSLGSGVFRTGVTVLASLVRARWKRWWQKFSGYRTGAWGVVQLGTMGLLFHARSIAFLEDVPEAKTELAAQNLSLFYIRVDEGYYANALNCWIGASFYCTLLLFSLCQCATRYWEVKNEKSKTESRVAF